MLCTKAYLACACLIVVKIDYLARANCSDGDFNVGTCYYYVNLLTLSNPGNVQSIPEEHISYFGTKNLEPA